MNRKAAYLLAALLPLPLLSCSALGLAGSPIPDVKPPNVRVSAVRVAELPTARRLASYYCAQYLGPLVCRAFGPVPQISDIDFAFDVELAVLSETLGMCPYRSEEALHRSIVIAVALAALPSLFLAAMTRVACR